MNVSSSGQTTHRARVLVALPDADGHRATYVRHLVAEGSAAMDIVLGVTPAALASTAFKTQLGELDTAVEMLDLRAPKTMVIALAEAAARIRADRVVVPDGDAVALALASAGVWSGPPLTVLVMREDVQERRYAAVTRVAQWERSRRIRRASQLPGVRVLTLRAPYDARPMSHDCAIDPVELSVKVRERDEWRRRYGLSDDVAWVAIVGANTVRKRADRVVEAIQALGPSTGVLVAGRMDDETRRAVEQSRDLTKVVIDRYMADCEIDGAVLAADVIAAVYSNDGPSGIVAKSLALGTPPVLAPTRAVRRALGASALPIEIAADATPQAISVALSRAAARGRLNAEAIHLATPGAFARKLLGDEHA